MALMARVRIVKSYVLDVFVNFEECGLSPDASDEEIEDVAHEITWDVEWPDDVKPDDASVSYVEIADRWEQKQSRHPGLKPTIGGLT